MIKILYKLFFYWLNFKFIYLYQLLICDVWTFVYDFLKNISCKTFNSLLLIYLYNWDKIQLKIFNNTILTWLINKQKK